LDGLPSDCEFDRHKKAAAKRDIERACLHWSAKHFGVESFTLRTKMLSLIGEQKARLDEIGFRPAWTLSVEVPLRSLGICRLSIYFYHAQF
jgi:hypothetical protein